MLKVDTYVKIVLTVIAVCLIIIVFKPIFSTPIVEARGGEREPSMNVRIVGIDMTQESLGVWSFLPVKIVKE